MAKYDWETIRKQYIQGKRQEDGTKHFPTLQELCNEHGCALGTIGDRAKKEDWKTRRRKFSEKIEKKVEEKKSEIEAEDIVESDENFESTGEKLRLLVDKKIDIFLENPTDVRAYDIKNVGDALRSAQEVVKTAQGEILERIGVETKDTSNDKLLNDPDYIAAKRKAMDDFYYAKSQRKRPE